MNFHSRGVVFRPLETFESPEMKSVYMKGLLYTVRTKELADLFEVWRAEGRVEVVGESSLPKIRIQGSGKVF